MKSLNKAMRPSIFPDYTLLMGGGSAQAIFASIAAAALRCEHGGAAILRRCVGQGSEPRAPLKADLATRLRIGFGRYGGAGDLVPLRDSFPEAAPDPRPGASLSGAHLPDLPGVAGRIRKPSDEG